MELKLNPRQQVIGSVTINLGDDFDSILDYVQAIGAGPGNALLAWLMRCVVLEKRVKLLLPSRREAYLQRESVFINAYLSGLVGGVIIRKNQEGGYDVTSHT